MDSRNKMATCLKGLIPMRTLPLLPAGGDRRPSEYLGPGRLCQNLSRGVLHRYLPWSLRILEHDDQAVPRRCTLTRCACSWPSGERPTTLILFALWFL